MRQSKDWTVASRSHSGVADRLAERPREGQRRHGLFRVRRVDLGLDVEAHGPVAAPFDQREDVSEARDALAIDRLLLRERRRILATRPDAADVVLAQLLIGEVDDRRTRLLEEPARGVARVVGTEQAVVADDDHAIFGHSAVELERRDADRERPRETGQRVLRGEAASAAMALEVEGRACGGLGGQGRDGCDGPGQHEREADERGNELHEPSLAPRRAESAAMISVSPATPSTRPLSASSTG